MTEVSGNSEHLAEKDRHPKFSEFRDKHLQNPAVRAGYEDAKRRRDQAEKDQTGTTWRATLPCPECGREAVIGYLLVNERGKHMHTRYACTFWPSNPPGLHARSVTSRCGWEGWTVPGWDAEPDRLTSPGNA